MNTSSFSGKRLIEERKLAEELGKNARKIADQINGPAIIEQWRDYIENVIAKKRGAGTCE